MAPDRSTEAGPSGPEETQARILAAAAELFSRQGYARATTRAIAEAAGINEVTLFRHFGTKKNLLMAVLERYSPLGRMQDLLERHPSGNTREDLLTLGRNLMAVFGEHRQALRLMLCEMGHLPELEEVVEQLPRQLRRSLGMYLQRQVDQGRVRALDPELMAQAYLGMFFAYNLYHELFNEPPVPAADPETAADQFVEIFCLGIDREGDSDAGPA